MQSNGIGLVFQYFFVVGFGVGSGLLIPVVIGLWAKNKISEGGFTWRRNSKSSN